MHWECVVFWLGLSAIFCTTICFIVNKILLFLKEKCDKNVCKFIKDLYEKEKIEK